MKKLSILLVGLLLVAGVAVAEVTFTLSGESTLTWGVKGSLIDNSAGFGDVNVNDLAYTSDSGEHSILPREIVLGMEVMDGDTVIVAAESKIDVDGTNGGDLTTTEKAYTDAFEYIEFPNVVPGVLGIKLNKSGTLGTDVTETKSTTGEPWVLVTATPVDGLTAKLGLLVEQNGLLRDTVDMSILPYVPSGDEVIWNNYIAFAASVFAEYVLPLGPEDEDGEFDNVTVQAGTVFDTAFSNGVWVEPNASVFDETYGPWNVVADAALVNPEDVNGIATLPLGLSVAADVSGLTASVDVRTRLVQGADVMDVDDLGVIRPAYATPLYAGVDVGYELEMGDMTVTPSANFKYSTDYWKWGINSDGDGFEYQGNVMGAEFVGYPMSAGLGVDVAGIAGILDVNLSGSVGLGDGEFAHAGAPVAFLWADILDAAATAATSVADVNDDFFVGTTPLAYKASIGLTAAVMDGVEITNTTSLASDTLGIIGQDAAVMFSKYFSQIKNDTKATYEVMIGDTAALTLFGKLNLTMDSYDTERGLVLQTDGTIAQTEQPGKTTFDWDFGIQVTVSTD